MAPSIPQLWMEAGSRYRVRCFTAGEQDWPTFPSSRPRRFRREAKLTGLNLLLTYEDGCLGRCSYCGLTQGREVPSSEMRTFIRVKWPTYSLEEIIARTKAMDRQFRRVCVSMITHRRAMA